MRLLCVAAVKLELALFLERLARPERIKFAGLKIWTGELCGREVILACCGIGPHKASQALERLFARFQFSRVLHTGVCGALSSELTFLRPLLARSVAAAWEPASAPIEIDPPAGVDFETLPEQARPQEGRFVTNALPVTTCQVKTFLRERFQADCVDMESWEVARACRERSISLSVVKAVSDSADSSLVDSFRNHAAEAAAAAQRVGLEIIRQSDF